MIRTSPGSLLRDTRGVSLVELLVGLTVAALVLTFAVSRLSARPYYLTADNFEFVGNLRVAREHAQSRTSAYRVRVASETRYVIERGVYNVSLGTWAFPIVERTVDLRGDVSFTFGDLGRVAQFDTRGWLVGSAVTFTLQDPARSETRQVVVYKTGMVESP